MSGPGGPPGAEGRGSCRGARLRSASGPAPGSASRDASLPFRPAPGPRLPGLPRLSPPASGPPPLGLRAPGIPARSFPRRPPSPRVPPPASPPSAFTCCGSGASRPGPCRRVSAAGPQPFPAAATTLSGAARRGAGLASSCVRGGRRSERAERGHTAALRPTGEEQPRRSPPREGGWAAAWGGVSRPPQWLPRSQVDLRPRPGAATSAAPHPHPRLSRMRRPAPRRRPGDPSPPVLAPRRLR